MTTEEKLKELESYVNKIYDNMTQDEIHCCIVADVLLARIEMAINSKKKLVKELSPKNPDLKKIVHRFKNLESSYVCLKLYQNAIKTHINNQFGESNVMTTILGVSSLFDRMFNMEQNRVELLHLCANMIEKGYIPSFVDLDMIHKQEIAKRANLPLEYVTKVLSFIPDVIVNNE